MRSDRRRNDQGRPLAAELGFNLHAEGSCIFAMGRTRVHCTATVTSELPRWRRDSGLGWINAEYRMLPRSTQTRSPREGKNDLKGRTAEIQRIVGRALRSVMDMKALGPLQVIIDCDVLQADGGTRTAAITGGYVALSLAVQRLLRQRKLKTSPLHGQIAAVSVGICKGVPVLDLDYQEDSEAETDMNVVMNDAGAFIELQGTAEGHAFRRDELNAMLALAETGIRSLMDIQRRALER